MPARCWAINASYGRCSKDGGHEDDHEVTFTWTDEEVVGPGVPVPLIGLPAYDDHPIHDAVLVDQAVGRGRCFSCGCIQTAHDEIGPDGEAMCSPHQCRTFVA